MYAPSRPSEAQPGDLVKATPKVYT